MKIYEIITEDGLGNTKPIGELEWQGNGLGKGMPLEVHFDYGDNLERTMVLSFSKPTGSGVTTVDFWPKGTEGDDRHRRNDSGGHERSIFKRLGEAINKYIEHAREIGYKLSAIKCLPAADVNLSFKKQGTRRRLYGRLLKRAAAIHGGHVTNLDNGYLALLLPEDQDEVQQLTKDWETILSQAFANEEVRENIADYEEGFEVNINGVDITFYNSHGWDADSIFNDSLELNINYEPINDGVDIPPSLIHDLAKEIAHELVR